MKSSQVRQTFIDFFKKNGHTPVTSSSLIPENDPTLLFTNAGMNQFKNLFLGLENRDYKRAVSSQKCVRAGGKHNDLENVGHTARHHTFFEMLGNFSFGDYFKKEAIHFAWELLTKEYQIPKEKLYVTVFENDDEAADIWNKQEGIPRERIFKFGEKDNFWRMGETGPCGPCTEIFYDHGENAGPEKDAFKGIASGGDRYVEIWNLVLMQFFEKSPKVFEPLPKPSVDTGSGLERLTAVMQGCINNYETDLFKPLIQSALMKAPHLSELGDLVNGSRKSNTPPSAALLSQLSALRVLADHCRSLGFLLADGAVPSNEGRGYVLRRILRRAIRYQKKLSEDISFLPTMIEVLSQEMGAFYPELNSRKLHILNVIRDEENRFTTTLDQGTLLLNEELQKLSINGGKVISGETVFKLYDTFGFPLDLTQLMAKENGFEINEKEFNEEMEKSRSKAKASWKGKGIQANDAHLIQWTNNLSRTTGPTSFTGYVNLHQRTKVIGLSNGYTDVLDLRENSRGFLITSESCFYAEGGGQTGDIGSGSTTSAHFLIHNTTKQNDVFIHHIEVQSGIIQMDDEVILQVHESERRKTACNHSGTHLLHSALREIVGTHVTQAGSLVDSDKLRFDYTHNKPLTSEELQKIEKMVNANIEHGYEVCSSEQSHSEAIQEGAMALFGEKYGDKVRVVKMGSASIELCGGTHVANTSQIRLFKIVNEFGVSAGVRRIEALTGENAISFLNKHYLESILARQLTGSQENWTQFLENNSSSLTQWIEDKKLIIKNLEKEVKSIQAKSIDLNEITKNAMMFTTDQKVIGKLALADLNIEDRDVLSQLADQIKNKMGHQSVVVIAGQSNEGNHPLIVSVSKDLTASIKAGDILKQISSIMGGKGGGRPDFAQGAAPNRDQLQAAYNEVKKSLGII